jgi:hypothetical protein
MGEALVMASVSPQLMADDAEVLSFQIGVTDLQALAATQGYRYELSPDGKEEYVIREDGTIIIRAFRVAVNMRGAKRKQPTVWMRALRYHTYMGKPQDAGDIYLAHDDQVENILALKFAVLDNPPPRARR